MTTKFTPEHEWINIEDHEAAAVGITLHAQDALGDVVFVDLPEVGRQYKRGEVAGTWLESHFRWQIHTFWFTLLWLVLSFLVMLTIIGIPIAAWVMIPVLGLWVGYRVLRGWLALSGGRQVGV